MLDHFYKDSQVSITEIQTTLWPSFSKTFILIFSSNKSLLSESNHRDVTIVLTKEDQEELGFFGPLKKIIGWSCRNNQFTGDSCNRQLMSGSHILSLVSKHNCT